MSTAEPVKRRNPWIWISVILGLVAVGLLIWALTLNSDLNDKDQQLQQAQAKAEQASKSGGTLAAAAKAAYDQLAQQIGATSGDVAAIEQQITSAQQDAAQAEQAVKQAQDDLAKAANDKSAQLKAQADQAQAEAQAARSKATIAGDCAKAYVSAIGGLLQGGNIQQQVAAVREQLQGITADCQSALSGGS